MGLQVGPLRSIHALWRCFAEGIAWHPLGICFAVEPRPATRRHQCSFLKGFSLVADFSKQIHWVLQIAHMLGTAETAHLPTSPQFPFSWSHGGVACNLTSEPISLDSRDNSSNSSRNVFISPGKERKIHHHWTYLPRVSRCIYRYLTFLFSGTEATESNEPRRPWPPPRRGCGERVEIHFRLWSRASCGSCCSALDGTCRSPAIGALSHRFFFWGGFRYSNRLQKKGYPYSNLSTGGPS